MFIENAPFLPSCLVNHLEQDSIKLGIKEDIIAYADLEKLKKQKLKDTQKEDVETHSAMLQAGYTTMVMNTNRNETNDIQPFAIEFPRNQDRSIANLATNRVVNNIQNMPINLEDQRTGISNIALISEANAETERLSHIRMRRANIQTDLGIHSNPRGSVVSPMNQSTLADRSLSSSRRENEGGGVSSRLSMSNATEILVTILFLLLCPLISLMRVQNHSF